MSHEYYDNPLVVRYASSQMSRLWGPHRKFTTWRRLWLILAESQQELGLPITGEQLNALRAHVDDIDLDVAAKYEREGRHDVMAHIKAYADACPVAAPIIHLGATSAYVTDNTDLLLMRESLQLIRSRLVAVIHRLAEFAQSHRQMACLGLTHLQEAQPTTVGKRACLWAHDLVMDLDEAERRLDQLKARGIQGATGTQASFLKLLGGDHGKVQRLQQRVAEKMGFSHAFLVTGQTYSRKVDSQILDTLSGISQSAHKAATDIRILASRHELEEPQAEGQVGSSAMPYKRNPMRSERICSLARFVMSLQSGIGQTLANQWLERSLDDSAIRRLSIPQAFLGVDAVLMLYQDVAAGLVVYPHVIARHLQEQLPFMAAENILMAAVAAGGNRQQLHEKLRRHSQAAARRIKEHAEPNDLLARLAADQAFSAVNLDQMLDASQFVGRAPEQVDQFIAEQVEPIRHKYPDALDISAEVTL